MSVNMAVIVGNLGKDPEIRHTQGGKTVANFSVATSEKWKDQSGNMQEKTQWHNITVWGSMADACGKYLSKGRQVYVQGKIETRSYEDKNGVTRYVTDIIAQRVQFLGGAQGGGGQQSSQERQGSGAPEEDWGKQSKSRFRRYAIFVIEWS